MPITPARGKPARWSAQVLEQEGVAQKFVGKFAEAMGSAVGGMGDRADPDAWQEGFEMAFQEAAATLPTHAATASKPWIGTATLALIDRRNAAAARDDRHEVELLKDAVKRSAKADRRRWLEDLLKTGEWSQVRKCRKGFAPRPSKLKDSSGKVVDSTSRANTMAEYFERVQWAVRPMTDAMPGLAPLGPLLDVQLGPVSDEEIASATKQVRRNRSSGVDNIPGEFWKLIAEKGSPGAEWLREFCNSCWSGKRVPRKWHLARVAAIFKKGRDDDCANYRPISLLCVAYKLFASILLMRLKKAGAENRVWSTQYGFRSKHSTADALFLARRMIEATWDQRDGKLMLLALDWAKAFDSVSPEALCESLRRFGVPPALIQMVRAIYMERLFYVQDHGAGSEVRTQSFGIAQSCPLLPFFFVMMTTVLMHDATRGVEAKVGFSEVLFLVTRT